MNNRNNVPAIIALVAALVFAVGLVSAAEPNGATIGTTADQGQYNNTAASTIDVDAGNITYADLSTDTSTLKWAGVYGNTSGNIILGDDADNQLYTWTAEGNLVYFANNVGGVDWTNLADVGEAPVEANYTFLTTGNTSDDYSATFLGGSENIGSQIFTTLSSDYAQTLNSSSVAHWKTYSLGDGTNLVFAGKVDPSAAAYDGSSVDYQVILPEDGTGANDGAATTWSVYVELI